MSGSSVLPGIADENLVSPHYAASIISVDVDAEPAVSSNRSATTSCKCSPE